mmetsp:Transcript_11704/g.23624  ORF Transcript_11704/g.23624 Transcript_11704/m.23624 type:complete len:211 (+) Transcript_11704:464-1096(+)
MDWRICSWTSLISLSFIESSSLSFDLWAEIMSSFSFLRSTMVFAYSSLSEASEASCALRYSTLLFRVRILASLVACRAAMVDSPSLYISPWAMSRDCVAWRDCCKVLTSDLSFSASPTATIFLRSASARLCCSRYFSFSTFLTFSFISATLSSSPEIWSLSSEALFLCSADRFWLLAACSDMSLRFSSFQRRWLSESSLWSDSTFCRSSC